MLKLPKGLKKKKKGKKSKKDQELFTEEEFEQYKREHQAQQYQEEDAQQSRQQQVEQPQQQQPQQSEGAAEGDDEWKKFAFLTTGIDSILKKTQGDLDRIKSTSFYQRVAPKKEEEVKVEEVVKKEEEAAAAVKEEEKDPVKQLLNAVVELSDSDDESDFDDTAFDTTFIEKVEAGELPVYYIPDEEEQDLGPDPFDTGYAEKVITGPEVSKSGKKIVNIGAAVEVLTGKVEASASSTKTRRQRRGIQNLLLESFELQEQEDNPDKPLEAELIDQPLKTILDEPAELPEDIPIDLSVSLHLKHQPPKKQENDEFNNEVLDEFDVINQVDVFLTDTLPRNEEDNTDWSEFELDRAQFPTRPPPPVRPPLPLKLVADDEGILKLDVDPFDTDYVEHIVPKAIDYDEDFDPRAGVEEEDNFDPREEAAGGLTVAKTDLLNTSHSDLASIAPTLAPNPEEEEEEIDPFDTSAIDKLVAPGKTELKFLERELLEQKKKEESLSDDDFDPRADEEPRRPSIEELKQRKSSLSLQIGSKLVSFSVPTPDLLKVGESEANGKIQKPLTPYYNRKTSVPFDEEPIEEDPFDTSFVPEIAPSTTELDLIEKEILTKEPTLKHSISDPDFDPRAITPVPKQESDLFLTTHNHDIKVLTPAKDSTPEEIEVDPFDTSIAANIVPGRIELQLLEDELIEKKPEAPPPTDILSDTQDNSIYVKILTPQPTGSIDLDQEDYDPFDTSFASNLAPGETETKLIEREFTN